MSGCSRGKTEIQTEAATHEPKHTIPGNWNPETNPFVVSIFSYTYQPQQRPILYIFWTNRKPHLSTDVIKSLATLVLPVHTTHMHSHWSARVKRTQPPPKCSTGSQPKTSMEHRAHGTSESRIHCNPGLSQNFSHPVVPG